MKYCRQINQVPIHQKWKAEAGGKYIYSFGNSAWLYSVWDVFCISGLNVSCIVFMKPFKKRWLVILEQLQYANKCEPQPPTQPKQMTNPTFSCEFVVTLTHWQETLALFQTPSRGKGASGKSLMISSCFTLWSCLQKRTSSNKSPVDCLLRCFLPLVFLSPKSNSFVGLRQLRQLGGT